MFHYRYIYKTVFGMKYKDFDAEDDEAAERIFWEGKMTDLNEIVMVEKSNLPVDEKGGGGTEQSDTEGLNNRADQLEERLDDDVLPGGGEGECRPVLDDVFGPAPCDCYAWSSGKHKGVKHFLARLLFGKKD